MPQHSPVSDETVRMRPDGSAGRTPLDVRGGTEPDEFDPEEIDPDEFDDTRPVPRDWLRGAPETTQAEQPPAAGDPASAGRRLLGLDRQAEGNLGP